MLSNWSENDAGATAGSLESLTQPFTG